jgi:Rrf2 family iron-sulfur cluster assembly transcriptional regulator
VRLTTKGRYAVTAMLDLAFHSQIKPVTLTDIATSQRLSRHQGLLLKPQN